MDKLEVGMVFRLPTQPRYGTFTISNIKLNKGKLLEMKRKVIYFDILGHDALDEKTALDLINSGYWKQVKQ